MESLNKMKSRIEIMDSTLRDGEQTNGVSFLPHEKLMIARLLLEKVNVDRLEVASARVSEGEKEAVTGICRFAEQAGYLDRIEVLGFVDHNKSVDWIADTGQPAGERLVQALHPATPQNARTAYRGHPRRARLR